MIKRKLFEMHITYADSVSVAENTLIPLYIPLHAKTLAKTNYIAIKLLYLKTSFIVLDVNERVYLFPGDCFIRMLETYVSSEVLGGSGSAFGRSYELLRKNG